MAAKTVLQSDVWNKKGTIIIDGGLGTEVDGRGFSIYVRVYSQLTNKSKYSEIMY